MDEFKVRFAPGVFDALGILWAAIAGKVVALTIPGPYEVEQEGNVITVRRRPADVEADRNG